MLARREDAFAVGFEFARDVTPRVPVLDQATTGSSEGPPAPGIAKQRHDLAREGVRIVRGDVLSTRQE
jgi:hypothetical protein